MHNCFVCDNKNLFRVIQLGNHPPADTFLKKGQISQSQKTYPLNCLLCSNCGHLQNEHIVPAKKRYVDSDYSYTSSNSESARQHWQEFCNTVSTFAHLTPSDHIIEFGSNDGYLLGLFQKKGVSATGIEPSPNTAIIARKNGVDTIQDFLSTSSVKKAVKKRGKASVILGNNVLNHIADLRNALQAIKFGLKPEGYFIFEVPSLRDTVEKYLFDMIFHEHVSCFSVKSIDYLLKSSGFFITKIENIAYHGGSLRIYACFSAKNYNKRDVKKRIRAEEKSNLFFAKTYKNFMLKINKDKRAVLTKLRILKKNGNKIAAVGAGARSNTLLNFYKLNNRIINFVSDASEYKIDKYTPGTLIPIKDDKCLASDNIDIAVITAWNIGKYLTDKIRRINPNIQCIVPGEKDLL